MISQRQISESAGPIFAIFSPNESVLSADDGSIWTSFFDISRDVAMATMAPDFVKKANSPFSLLWYSETEWDIATLMCALTVQMMPVYRVKIS